MRLSDVKGERVFDVVADLIDPIVSIAEDKEAAELFEPKSLPDGMTPYEFFISRVKKSLPPLMRNHKDELVTIFCTIKGVDRKTYMEELTLGQLFADLTELVTDNEFSSFFG